MSIKHNVFASRSERGNFYKLHLGSFFPFFVVGSKYFEDIPAETNMTIVDRIIGEVLSIRASANEISKFKIEKLGISQEEFDQLSPPDQH